MTAVPPQADPFQCSGRVTANAHVCRGLIRLDVDLDRDLHFFPGQFAMLNLPAAAALVFSRPFSILTADGPRASFLFRVVGRGTRALAEVAPGQALTFLGPFGRPFPAPAAGTPAVLIAGGVGLPPLFAWHQRYGRPGDQAFFGARDSADVPWTLLDDSWCVAAEKVAPLEPGRTVRAGLVTDLVRQDRVARGDRGLMALACGPLPMLKAAADLAAAAGWECWLSLEEHMGCGYGVCKGCVVPVRAAEGAGPGHPDGWRNATCCQDGPVFRATDLDWPRLSRPGSFAPA